MRSKRVLPYLNRPDTPYTRSQKQEKDAAKRYGGRTTSGSGNKRDKGDVSIYAGVRLEAKRTDKNSISVKKEWLQKISEEAFAERQRPAVEIEIQDEQWVLIPELEFRNYIEYLKQGEI